LALSVNQLLAIEADPSSNNLPPGDTWTVTDTAAKLETLSLGAISTMPLVGRLRVNVDFIGPHHIAGWAENADYSEAPVCGYL
jgi:hypothetical protein